MSEIELHPGTPCLSSSDLNRLARQQELSVVIAKAKIFDQICQEVELTDEQETELIQTFLNRQGVSSDSELEDYLALRGWQEADMIYVATKGERLRQFQNQVFGQEVELNYLSHKIDLDQICYSVLMVQDADLAFELHQQLQEGEQRFEDLLHKHPICSLPGLSSGDHGPHAISRAHPALTSRLRVGHPAQLWPPFFEEQCWIILQLHQRNETPLNESTREKLLDQAFEQWLNQSISQLLVGEDTAALPHNLLKDDPAAALPDTKPGPTSNPASIALESSIPEQILQSSISAVSAHLLPGRVEARAFPTKAWRDGWRALLDKDSCVPIPFSEANTLLKEIVPQLSRPAPRLLKFNHVLWQKSQSGLFSPESGLVLEDTYQSRYLRKRQSPNLRHSKLELACSAPELPWLQKAIYLPSMACGSFHQLITQSMPYLWPWLIKTSHKETTDRVVIGSSNRSTDQWLGEVAAIIQQGKGQLCLNQHLPSILCLDDVWVPTPIYVEEAGFSEQYLEMIDTWMARVLGQEANKHHKDSTKSKLFLTLDSGIRRDNRTLEALADHAKQRGWITLDLKHNGLQACISGLACAERIISPDPIVAWLCKARWFQQPHQHLTLFGQQSPGLDLFQIIQRRNLQGVWVPLPSTKQQTSLDPEIIHHLIEIAETQMA